MIAWEPVPHFRAILEWVVAANNVSHLVTVRGRVVTNKDGELITIQVGAPWGTRAPVLLVRWTPALRNRAAGCGGKVAARWAVGA